MCKTMYSVYIYWMSQEEATNSTSTIVLMPTAWSTKPGINIRVQKALEEKALIHKLMKSLKRSMKILHSTSSSRHIHSHGPHLEGMRYPINVRTILNSQNILKENTNNNKTSTLFPKENMNNINCTLDLHQIYNRKLYTQTNVITSPLPSKLQQNEWTQIANRSREDLSVKPNPSQQETWIALNNGKINMYSEHFNMVYITKSEIKSENMKSLRSYHHYVSSYCCITSLLFCIIAL